MAEEEEQDELTRLALEELDNGVKRAKERSDTMGALGWSSKGRPQTNKKYLHNTVLGVVKTNQRIEQLNAKQTPSNKDRQGPSSGRLFSSSLKDLTKNKTKPGCPLEEDKVSSDRKEKSEKERRDRSPIDRPKHSRGRTT